MEAKLYSEPRPFMDLVEGWLAKDPFSTNVIGVFTGTVVSGRRELRDDYLWLAVLDENGEVIGAAMHTPPFRVFLPRLGTGVAACMAEALLEAERNIPGVNGELAAVKEFLELWQARTGTQSKRDRAMRLYRLGALAPPREVKGTPRLAASEDVDTVAGWLAAFQEESAAVPVFDLAAEAAARIAHGLFWLWTDESDRPVSVAGVSDPVLGVARVGPVYTPPEERRHGYGSAVTAAATQAGLDRGAEHMVLYTDLANPVSNSIYQKIGYVADHDAEEREILPV